MVNYSSVLKLVAITLVSIIYVFGSLNSAQAKENKEEPELLLIYSAKDGEINEMQRIIDNLLSHFSENIHIVSSDEVKETDLTTTDYLFYYGEIEENLAEETIHLINDFSGSVTVFGQNVEQLERFSFMEMGEANVVAEEAFITDNPNHHLTFIPQYILEITSYDRGKVEEIMTAKGNGREFPLIIRHQNDFYFASDFMRSPFSILFAEGLHYVFEQGGIIHEADTQGYIRLEDVHPLVDPKPLMEIAETLKAKNIPYMIAVIPIYTNPETGKQYKMSDSPKLLKALKYMQDNGGSIVLHGYTHQFRLSETGEGFEFWDVEHNSPIYHTQDDKVSLKTENDFATQVLYEEHQAENLAFERAYVEDRLTKGIEELSNYGLYPLAFEAPHYTMSQNGYEVTADFFSTYVGQLQLSDKDWEIMGTIPYESKPQMLNGMTLLPETIGYVEPQDPRAIDKMMEKAEQYQFVRDSFVGGFYHPYLGAEQFNYLMERLEEHPEINWIDLKEYSNHVQTDYAEITTENGELTTNISYFGMIKSSFDYIYYHVHNVILFLLWTMAAIGIFAVINFIGHTIYSISRRSVSSSERKEEVFR